LDLSKGIKWIQIMLPEAKRSFRDGRIDIKIQWVIFMAGKGTS
jgi:hypothetical protein